MRRKDFFSQFESLAYFSKETIKLAASKFAIPDNTLDSWLTRAVKNRELYRLKMNFYVTAKFYDEHKGDLSYSFYLANTFIKPSYVSLESALQYHGILTEAVSGFVSSVTNKSTREIKNTLSIYKYKNITENLFTDFRLVKGFFEFLIAKPHKAVFDYLYYKTVQFAADFSPNLIEEFRLDLEILNGSDKKSLEKLIKNATSKEIKI